jgi:dipeptidyl aminopeptidase/acylaminoacyl peptidase
VQWLSRLALFVFLSMVGCGGPAPIEAESIGHPDRDGARIEYFLRRPDGAGPRPTIVFLHGHQHSLSRPGGAAFVRWGVFDRYAAKGYLAVSISLPGYGGSDGPEDFAGPFTQNAVEAVLARLTADGLAARDEVVIEGISLGAVTAALVAARDPRVKGLVLISGLYDLPAFLADPRSAGAREIALAVNRQTGGGEDALRSRSALLFASRIKASALILNGAGDDRTDPAQALRLAERINGHGGRARAHIYPEYGHEIPVKARQSEVDAFIAATFAR